MAVVASLILAAAILGAGIVTVLALEGWHAWSSRRSPARRRMGWAARLRALPARVRR